MIIREVYLFVISEYAEKCDVFRNPQELKRTPKLVWQNNINHSMGDKCEWSGYYHTDKSQYLTCRNKLQINRGDTSTSWVLGFIFKISHFQLHQFSISTYRIHELNLKNIRFEFHNSDFVNSRFQFCEFEIVKFKTWVHGVEFMRLKSWIR
jgi:hypothetical protein